MVVLICQMHRKGALFCVQVAGREYLVQEYQYKWPRTDMFWLPRGYLKAVYLFSNLHAEGFCRSMCGLWPCCDPGGTDAQAPHLMTAAEAMAGHSHGSDLSSTLPSPERHSSLTGTQTHSPLPTPPMKCGRWRQKARSPI